jgi:hypothetical protein
MTLGFPYTYGDDLSSAVANERVKKFALLSLLIAVPYFMSGSTAIAKDVPNQAGNHTSSSITTTAGKLHLIKECKAPLPVLYALRPLRRATYL